MSDERTLLEISDLRIQFSTDFGLVKAVDGINLSVKKNKTLAIVGESGCGKSVTGLSILRLFPKNSAKIPSGKIIFAPDNEEPVDLLQLEESQMEKIRGNKIAMVFQEPMTSLNPIFTVGNQLEEAISLHNPQLSKGEAVEKALDLLHEVGIPGGKTVFGNYPHELSGGMRQRVMIAMAISCNPSLLIADEPTTALDVTVQAQILDLLYRLQEKSQMSIILITHDLGVVAENADDVAVMYAGKVIERAASKEFFANPVHPYSRGLLHSASRSCDEKTNRLYSIEGSVPGLIDLPDYCTFYNRCSEKSEICKKSFPQMRSVGKDHFAVCFQEENHG